MPSAFDDWRMDLSELPRYVDWVAEAREVVAPLPVRISLECDFLEGREGWLHETAELVEWDYLIGSVHYLTEDWALDDPRHLSRWTGQGTVEEIWARYWSLYEKCVRTGCFDFCAHPDLAKKFGFRPAGDLRPYYEPVISALAGTGTAVEINTAGLHKEVREMYPAPDFLRMAREAGVAVVINSDAHAPEEVGRDFAAALELARSVGYRETLRFCKRRREVVPLPETWPLPL